LRYWGLNSWLEPLHQCYFCEEFFKIRSRGTVWLGWLRTAILLISASAARITGMSHWHPAQGCFLKAVWQHTRSFFFFHRQVQEWENQPGSRCMSTKELEILKRHIGTKIYLFTRKWQYRAHRELSQDN
jgi:hypothetical protein